MSRNKKKEKTTAFEKAVAAWLKYDPLVTIVVKNDSQLRRDVMLNLLGPKAAMRHFGKFSHQSPGEGPVYPSTVRKTVEQSFSRKKERTMLIKTLIRWASDPYINNRYIKSHLTRIQIVTSLLGPIFSQSSSMQDDLIMKGLKYVLAKKVTVVGEKGEQSTEVHNVLLTKIIDILIYNQKVIISKAVSEGEDKMRVNLIRQIQELSGEKVTAPFYDTHFKSRTHQTIKEKFPLPNQTAQHLEEMLGFYNKQTKWPHLQERAQKAETRLNELRKPSTLTSQEHRRYNKGGFHG